MDLEIGQESKQECDPKGAKPFTSRSGESGTHKCSWAGLVAAAALLLIPLAILCGYVGDIHTLMLQSNKLQGQAVPDTLSYQEIQNKFVKHPSFLNYYTGDTETLYLEIPASYFELNHSAQAILFSAVYTRQDKADAEPSKVPKLNLDADAGEDHQNAFRFSMTSDSEGVDIIQIQQEYRATNEGDNERIKKGAWSGWKDTLPVVASNSDGGSVVVDASSMIGKGFYISDVSDAEVARLQLDKCTSFPTNMLLTAEYHTTGGDGEPTTTGSVIAFTLSQLPAVPMVARAYDDRIGYFTSSYLHIGDHRDDPNYANYSKHDLVKVDTRVTFIQRYRLESGPNFKPITYYIDPSVPEKWRPTFKAAVEAWDPAFVAAGFPQGSIRAVLPGDPNWPHDYNIGDIRFSTVSYIFFRGTRSQAMMVTDPRTGEILKGGAVISDSWGRQWLEDLALWDQSHGNSAVVRDGDTDSPVVASPERRSSKEASFADQHSHSDHVHGQSRSLQGGHVPGQCSHAMAHHNKGLTSLLRMMLEAEDVDAPARRDKIDNIISQGLKWMVTHEVGHTLGLRHNFKASTAVSWEQSQDKQYTQKHGLSASVMDYMAMNVVSGRPADVEVDYFTPVIGEYDYLAIKYGYMEVEGEESGLPHPTLVALADHNLPFASDEDTGAFYPAQDPYVTWWDLTSDPIRYYNDRLDVIAELRPKLLDQAAYPGDPLMGYTTAQSLLLGEIQSHIASSLAIFIGGYNISHAHRPMSGGEFPGPIRVVSAADQQRALDSLLRVMVDDGPDADGKSILPQPLEFPYTLLKNDTECNTFGSFCYGRSASPLVEWRGYVQSGVLGLILDPGRLKRLQQGAWYQKAAGEEPFGVANLFQGLTNGLWGPQLAQSPRVLEPGNWGMQLLYLRQLQGLAGMYDLPPEVKILAFAEYASIKQSVQAALAEEGAASQPSYPFLQYISLN